ncbi:hypothetical protein AB0953_29690 [Streptomyces sp. NPDC046866]|uniref:hypothetical protein n=1 Tax=Streptomyces sp. NPDC046866 TaxID=3154921 RepID=UPI003453794D
MTQETLPPRVREAIAGVVEAVSAGDDARIDRLLEQLVRVAPPNVLYELRRQLARGSGPP